MLNKSPTSPIAIIGIGCRFPGGAHGPDRFWSLLESGECVIKAAPPERWSTARHYEPDPNAPRRTYVREGGYLEGPIERFDAAAFNISPREAATMDPQQRLLLEVAVEALEDAHLSRQDITGSNTGVYIGAFSLDYQALMLRPENAHLVGSSTAAGMTMAAISNRLSHALDLRGASLSIDTACSASLVALHYACSDLRAGAIEMALTGGVNVSLLPEFLFALCKGGFLSPEARSKAFDISANGYARGEGAGILVLKPLHAAEADGDPIHGVIHASGVNQDGHTDGISRPCAEAQKRLIASVYSMVDLKPQDLAFIETHGTGTQVGDQAEADAIGQTIGQLRDVGDPILLGTLKSNIGHLEAAAGVASVIKSVLALKHGVLPKNPLLKEPNPAIDFMGLNLRVPYDNEPLYPETGPRFAGINGFGYGGTNAHAIVSSYMRQVTKKTAEKEGGLLLLSAHTEDLLRQTALAHCAHLAQSEVTVDAHAMASARLRTDKTHRAAILAPSKTDLISGLEMVAKNQPSPAILTGAAQTHKGLVLAFSGMGMQYPKMGAALLETMPSFAKMVDKIDTLFQDNWQISPKKYLLVDDLPSNRTDIAQWTNFTLQLGLCAVIEDWGITPSGVYGHSAGEVAAAWRSGCLSFEQACLTAYHRGRILQRMSGTGGMIGLGLGYDQAMEVLSRYPDLDLAAVNGPGSTTLSGQSKMIAALNSELQEVRTFARILNTSVAYHSRMIEPLEASICADLACLSPERASYNWISTVAPEIDPIPNADYWAGNARKTVHFQAATDTFLDAGETLFLEIGAHPVLTREIHRTANERGLQISTASTLRHGLDAQVAMDRMRASFFVSGGQADWPRMMPQVAKAHGELPLPVWSDTCFFLESSRSEVQRKGPAVHALLGENLHLPTPTWQAQISAKYPSFLAGHTVLGKVIFPAASYIEMGLAAAAEVSQAPQMRLRNLSFVAPLVLPKEGEVTLSSSYTSQGILSIRSNANPVRNGNDWITHATLELVPIAAVTARKRDISELIELTTGQHDVAQFYDELNTVGLGYTDGFRQIQQLWTGNGIAISKLEPRAENSLFVDPCLMDGALQTALSLLPELYLMLPNSAAILTFLESPKSVCYAVARKVELTSEKVVVDIELLGEDGSLLVAIQGLTCTGLPNAVASKSQGWIYRSTWPQLPQIDNFTPSHNILILNGNDQNEWQDILSVETIDLVDRQAAIKSAPSMPRDAIYVCPNVSLKLERQLFELSQFILSYPRNANNQIVIVTQDCQGAVSGDRVGNPNQAGFWGAARSFRLDRPNLRIRLIDMPALKTVSNFRDLLKFCSTSQAQEAILRNGGTYGHLLRPVSLRDFDDNHHVIQHTSLHQPVVLDITTEDPCWKPLTLHPCDTDQLIVHIESVSPAPEFSNYFDASAEIIQSCLESFPTGHRLTLTGGAELLASHLPCRPETIHYGIVDHEKSVATTLCARLETAFSSMQNHTPVVIALSYVPNIKVALDWAVLCGNPIAILSSNDIASQFEDVKMFDENGFETAHDLCLFLGDNGVILRAESWEKPLLDVPALHARMLRLDQLEKGRGIIQNLVSFDVQTQSISLRPKHVDFNVTCQEKLPLLRPNEKPLPVYIEPKALKDQKGITLVTGGLSGFGAELAISLAEKDCSAIALIGRRGTATLGALALIERIKSLGSEVRVLALDICDKAKLKSALARLRQEFGAINAVFHSAGQVSNVAPKDLSEESFAISLEAKCIGTLTLEELTIDDPLLHFCTIGSVSGLLGNRNQAPYSAANAILSALAARRRANGLPSFNAILGAVGNAGTVAKDPTLKLRLASIGVHTMDAELLLSKLHELNQLEAYHSVMIADIDWAKWSTGEAASPLAQLAHAAVALQGAATHGTTLSEQDILSVVQTALSSSLQSEPAQMSKETTINSLGLDSLAATEVSLFIQTATGLVMDPLDVLSATNIGSLADALDRKRLQVA